MMMKFSLSRLFALLVLAALLLSGCGQIGDWLSPYESELGQLGDALLDQLLDADSPSQITSVTEAASSIKRDGTYTARDDVALYLNTYGELPNNFITKNEARKLGWVSSEGNLHEVAPGKSIGGDYFSNYEGKLPQASGRKYYECDIGYTGGYRGAERIVYSNDGLIFYTADHYNTFTQLYP